MNVGDKYYFVQDNKLKEIEITEVVSNGFYFSCDEKILYSSACAAGCYFTTIKEAWEDLLEYHKHSIEKCKKKIITHQETLKQGEDQHRFVEDEIKKIPLN